MSNPRREPPGAETEHWRRWAESGEPDWEWPEGREVAVNFTFDVDAESAMLSLGEDYDTRLSTLSDARFSVVRGVPRLLEMLRRYEAPATFFIPGWTAENYPHVVEKILEAGHEVGHHGYLHARTDQVSLELQKVEIERGFAALESVGASRPRGYRSTAWEVTPETFEMIVDAGFLYDSSFMSDDRPYVERHGGRELLEIPSHWGLDDWAYFGYLLDFGGNVFPSHEWRRNWKTEYEQALTEGRTVTYTCHPEISGRAYRQAELERLLGEIREDGRAWIATMEEVATHVAPRLGIEAGSAPAPPGGDR